MKKLLMGLIAFLAFSGIAMATVNLNTASKEELEAVKGIGPQKAAAILEYRRKNGPFKKLDDLKKVNGFGDKSVAKMRSELTLEPAAVEKGVRTEIKKENKPVKR